MDDARERLPDVPDHENPVVWCERCQRHHRRYTFTRAAFDRVISENAQELSDRIDAQAIDFAFGSKK